MKDFKYVLVNNSDLVLEDKQVHKEILRVLSVLEGFVDLEVRKVLTDGEVCVVFVSNKENKRLNKQFDRDKEECECLTFVYEPDLGKVRADILINADYIDNSSKEEFDYDEFRYVFLHSFLHVLGYNHKEEKDALKMEKMEDLVLKSIDIPQK